LYVNDVICEKLILSSYDKVIKIRSKRSSVIKKEFISIIFL
jgi:hypothetical protein